MPPLALALLLALPGAAAPARARKARPPAPPPAQAQPAPDPMRERLAELRREGESLLKELNAPAEELARLGNTYAAVPDPRPLFARRDAHVARLRDGVARLTRLDDEFSSLRSASDANSVAMLVNSFVSGQDMPGGMEGAYFHYNEGQEFSRTLRNRRDLYERTLAAEAAQHKAALHALEVQRRWVVGTSLGGGILVVLFGGALWWRHKTARTAVYVTGPTGQPMLLEGDAALAALPPPSVPAAQAGPAPAEPGAGAVLGGNYRVERVLGRGGMGVVFEAVDLTLQRKVAIKRMTAELLEAGHDFELFVNEARLVAQLKHPNIVEIHSILREGGLLHLVFEFVEGRPLSAFLEQNRRIAFRSVKAVVRQTASALDYAHARKVIHRDLKPANVMVGRGGAVKVMDFGIAHQAKLTAKMTKTGAWGTPPYMAPEQELGSVGRESDVFALGVCVYEMATGRLPYSGPNFLAQKRERVYKPATTRVKELPAGLDAVLAKALDPDPAARYRTPGELAAALDALPD